MRREAPVSASDEQRALEIARGQEVLKRNEEIAALARIKTDDPRLTRQETLARLIDGGKLRVMGEGKNMVAHVIERHIEGGLGMVTYTYVTGEANGPAHPTEQFVAACGLAVQALVGMDGVPEKSRRQAAIDEERWRQQEGRRQNKDYAKRYVHDWSKGEP